MPTPNNHPYKVQQRELKKKAKSVQFSKAWYDESHDRQRALITSQGLRERKDKGN